MNRYLKIIGFIICLQSMQVVLASQPLFAYYINDNGAWSRNTNDSIHIADSDEWLFIVSDKHLYKIDVNKKKVLHKEYLGIYITSDQPVSKSGDKIILKRNNLLSDSRYICPKLIQFKTKQLNNKITNTTLVAEPYVKPVDEILIEKNHICSQFEKGYPAIISSNGQLVSQNGEIFEYNENGLGKHLWTIPNDRILRPLQILWQRFIKNDTQLLTIYFDEASFYDEEIGENLVVVTWDLTSRKVVNKEKVTIKNIFAAQTFVSYSEFTNQLNFVYAKNYESKEYEFAIQNLNKCDSDINILGNTMQYVWKHVVFDPFGQWWGGIVQDKNKINRWLRIESKTGKILNNQIVDKNIIDLIVDTKGENIYGLIEFKNTENVNKEEINVNDLYIHFKIANNFKNTQAAENNKNEICANHKYPVVESPIDLTVAKTVQPLWERQYNTHTRFYTTYDEFDRYVHAPRLTSYQDTDENIWIDHDTHLQKVAPLTGQTIQKQLTPRTKERRAVVSFYDKGFVTFQGDTLAFRPFEDNFNNSNTRKLIAQNKGWEVVDVSFMKHGYLLSKWLANTEVIDQLKLKYPNKQINQLYMLHDMQTNKLIEKHYDARLEGDDYRNDMGKINVYNKYTVCEDKEDVYNIYQEMSLIFYLVKCNHQKISHIIKFHDPMMVRPALKLGIENFYLNYSYSLNGMRWLSNSKLAYYFEDYLYLIDVNEFKILGRIKSQSNDTGVMYWSNKDRVLFVESYGTSISTLSDSEEQLVREVSDYELKAKTLKDRLKQQFVLKAYKF